MTKVEKFTEYNMAFKNKQELREFRDFLQQINTDNTTQLENSNFCENKDYGVSFTFFDNLEETVKFSTEEECQMFLNDLIRGEEELCSNHFSKVKKY